MRKIIHCLVDDTPLPLLFSLGAEMEIADRMGDVDALFDLFQPPEGEAERTVRLEIEKGMTPEQLAARDARTPKRGVSLMEVLPFAIATLARQGQLYQGEKATVTEAWVSLHARPADIEPMTLAMCKAIEAGLDTRHPAGNGDVDLVAEALEKN